LSMQQRPREQAAGNQVQRSGHDREGVYQHAASVA
jgi:hypothetical protein